MCLFKSPASLTLWTAARALVVVGGDGDVVVVVEGASVVVVVGSGVVVVVGSGAVVVGGTVEEEERLQLPLCINAFLMIFTRLQCSDSSFNRSVVPNARVKCREVYIITFCLRTL